MTSGPQTSSGGETGPVKRLLASFKPIPFLVGTLIVAVGLIMWPAQFGGLSTVTIVAGESMEPTYSTGDLIFAWRTVKSDVGDVVVFEVPQGQPGAGGLVIHRVTGIDANVLITQGDNNGFRDPWSPTQANVLGSPSFHVPHAGSALYLLGSPYALAMLLGIGAAALLWPKRKHSEADDPCDAYQDQTERPIGDGPIRQEIDARA